MRKTIILAAAAMLSAGPAFAHARLTSAKPGVGATVPSARSITLDFSEGVVPAYSGITLKDAAGTPVKLGVPATGPSAQTLVVPIGAPLAPGTYSVGWHAVSIDTHRTQGSFRFTVAP